MPRTPDSNFPLMWIWEAVVTAHLVGSLPPSVRETWSEGPVSPGLGGGMTPTNQG